MISIYMLGVMSSHKKSWMQKYSIHFNVTHTIVHNDKFETCTGKMYSSLFLKQTNLKKAKSFLRQLDENKLAYECVLFKSHYEVKMPP